MKEAMKSVVLLSGGIDSTVALAMSLRDGVDCALAVTFNYGQAHWWRESCASSSIAGHYDVAHKTVDIRECLPAASALTGTGQIPTEHADRVDATFVPGRNLVMLSVGVSIAASVGAGIVIIGANAADDAGYPDCRPAFIDAVDESARLAYRIGVWAPLLRMSKRQVVDRGVWLDAPLQLTWSCYRGGDEPCNQCGACESRNEAMA
jgi:7-cyano-7-deazaguanine synthase